MKTCKCCFKEFDEKQLARSLGKESSPVILGYCSARCYTLSRAKTLGTIDTILEEIRQQSDLKKFKEECGDAFCKKYEMTGGQFNFVLSVIASERIQIQ